MTARTLQALRFLGLIDESGYSLEELEHIRRAREQDLPSALRPVVRSAYSMVFAELDPATATDRQLIEAFRGHEPAAQRPKMVALFRALCVRAGLIPGDSSPKASADAGEPRAGVACARVGRMAARVGYPLIDGLLETLPRDGHWTGAERDRWVHALEALLDLSVRIDDGDEEDG